MLTTIKAADRAASAVTVNLWRNVSVSGREAEWREFAVRFPVTGLHCDPRWLASLSEALDHQPFIIDARRNGKLVGLLPLAFVRSALFGRFLVSLPYVNWAGIVAYDEQVGTALIDRAIQLADELDVRYLELRNEREWAHPLLTSQMTDKVQMRLPLAAGEKAVWKGLRSVVRTQVRKGEKQGFTTHWGGLELLDQFYHVFATNMRDLGTPVFGQSLFHSLLTRLPGQAELCVLRSGKHPVAGALAIHGPGITEVPSASVLRAFRSKAANSLMYWRLIHRAVTRGQSLFDFGRSTIDSSTYVFKSKWGTQPEPAIWQYCVRKGNIRDMRPDGGKYDRLIALWKRLPVSLTRLIGPRIVRGIP